MTFQYGRHYSTRTEGNEDAHAVFNASQVTQVTSPLPSGEWSTVWKFADNDANGSLTFRTNPRNVDLTTSLWVIYNLYLYFDDTTPEDTVTIWAQGNSGLDLSSGSGRARLDLLTTGNLEFRDDLNSLEATATTPFTSGQYHKLQIRFRVPQSGANSGTSFQAWVDGSEIISEQTGFDAAAAGWATNNYWAVQGFNAHSGDNFMYLAGAYTQIESTVVGDRNDDDFEIIGPYSISELHTGASPDNDGDNSGTPDTSGDDLDGDGTVWNRTAEIPFSDETKDTDLAEYDGTPKDGSCYCDGSTRSGPLDDTRIDGDSEIKLAQYVFRAERGNGGGSAHTAYFGNKADSSASNGTFVMTLGTSPGNFIVSSEDTDVVPLSTEDARMGFGVVGNRNIYMHEMVCTLLHVPAAPAGGAVPLFFDHLAMMGHG